jgi:ATP-dependent helicase/nuclease subunit A
MSKKTLTATPQQSKAANPELSVWVSANAGSGKTHVLVERVVRLLLQGNEPSAILCITYTKAAAAEMSARLFKRLGTWTALDDASLLAELTKIGVKNIDETTLTAARRLFTKALETPGGLKIQTIHAFCEKLLQLFPVEAGLAPGFKVLDERAEQDIRDAAIIRVLKSAEADVDQDLSNAFRHISANTNSEGFGSLIREFLGGAKGLRNLLAANLDANGFSLALKNAAGLALDLDSESIARDIADIDAEAYLHHAQILSDYKKHGSHDTVYWLRESAKNHDNFSKLKTLFLTEKLTPRASLLAGKTAEKNPSTAEFLKSEQQRVVGLLLQHDLYLRIEATSNLFKVAKAVFEIIESQKRLLGLYDFDDLISRTAKLLTNSRAAQWVLYKLDAGLKHILVDEAQDTSPAQWQIVKAITEEFFSGEARPQKEDRTVFVVGDRKQSIFSFQGADAQAFIDAHATFETQLINGAHQLENVDLSISYRSTQEILDAVDTVFPTSAPLQFGFSSDDIPERPHQTSRLGLPGVVEIWPLCEPLEKEEEEPWTAPVDREPSASPRRRLARDIASTIKSWLGSRTIAARNRVVKPDDILILLQSRGPLFSMLIAELRRAGVPVAGADRLKLLESLAIQDLLALMQWILLPEDDHALACILKSPLLPSPLTEEQLFKLAHGRGGKSLWMRLKEKQDQNSAVLEAWQKLAHSAGPHNFLAQVLSQRRKAMIERLGTEAEDATDALLDQAIKYEYEQGQSLAGFMHWFNGQQGSLKREMEKDTGEVRLMTVHGAKGLEANIVFLADAASIPRGNNSAPKLLRMGTGLGLPLWKLSDLSKSPIQEKWEDEEKLKIQAERNRLLYVAMTRACDELYICGTKSDNKIPAGCWYETITTALIGPNTNVFKRFGPEPTFQPYIADEKSEEAEFPPWLFQDPQKEIDDVTHGLTRLISKDRNPKNYDAAAARRGIAIHALLQDLPDLAPDKRAAFAKRKAMRSGLSELDTNRILELLDNPQLAQFFGPESRAEAELRGYLDDGRLVTGRVDRITMLPHEILLLDFKSDRFVPDCLTADNPYAQQLALYTELLHAAYPDHTIRAALLWTDNAKLEWVSEKLLTQARDQAITVLEPEAS